MCSVFCWMATMRNRVLPTKAIGRLDCTVTTEQAADGTWQLQIESLLTFEKVFSLAQSAVVADNEHFGLVTREECE
uniref:Uncharacterized protein n=1 Tax=Caenorhabditis japonica TaxID=281687 RepID=A0A8R1EK32_CAEJA